MMNKYSYASSLQRRNRLREIVREGDVRSQKDLARLLADSGIAVAQATLSRDIRELGLVKGPSGYLMPVRSEDPPVYGSPYNAKITRLARALRDSVIHIETAGNLVILKTPPAGASLLAKVIDESGLEEIAGTIAGDDTIFVATKSSNLAKSVRLKFTGYIDGSG